MINTSTLEPFEAFDTFINDTKGQIVRIQRILNKPVTIECECGLRYISLCNDFDDVCPKCGGDV